MKTTFTNLFIVAGLLTGCLPARPTRTTRPDIAVPPPWTTRHVHSNSSGADYEYLTIPGPSADAPVILLLHGGIFDHLIWLNTGALSQRFTVIAPRFPDNSLYYHGHVEDWGRIVRDFIAVSEVDPDYIAAVSNGAYAAIEYLLQTPDNNVKGLALLSTVMFSINDEEIKKRTKMAKRALNQPPERLRAIVQHRVMNMDVTAQTGSHRIQDIFSVRPYPYYYQVFSVAKNQQSRKQDTAGISVPVLVIHGTEDELMPVWAARLTTDVFPNARFREVTGARHPMVFTHGNTVARLLVNQL